MRLARTLLLTLLVALVVGVPGSASAHDELVASDPADGATVATTPAGVTLTFSGPIAQVGAAVVVTAEDDAPVVQGGPLVDGTEVVQPLVENLAPGGYDVTWRVTSQDGHPISGTFTFTVEGAPDDGPAAGGGSEGTAAAPVTQEPTDEPSEEPQDEPAEDPAPVVAEDAAGGLPVWVWLVLGVAVAGLLALLVRTATRNRR